jgi:hypothetical protein
MKTPTSTAYGFIYDASTKNIIPNPLYDTTVAKATITLETRPGVPHAEKG